jgi:ankyrin repeat protein
VSQEDFEKFTPLHSAVLGVKNLKVLRTLLVAGADVNALNDSEETPTDYAKKKKDREILELLSSSRSLLATCHPMADGDPRYRRVFVAIFYLVAFFKYAPF